MRNINARAPPCNFIDKLRVTIFSMTWARVSRLLVYGFTTYAAIFMLWAFFAAYALARGPAPRITAWAATAIVVFYAATLLRPASFKSTLGVGLLWSIMHLALDALYVIPAAGILAFTTYNSWTNYGIVFLSVIIAFLYQYSRGKTDATVEP